MVGKLIPGSLAEVFKVFSWRQRNSTTPTLREQGHTGGLEFFFWPVSAGLGIHPHPEAARGARPSMTVKAPRCPGSFGAYSPGF